MLKRPHRFLKPVRSNNNKNIENEQKSIIYR